MAGEGINPFNFSTPVGEADLIDRKEELRQIMDLVWSGNNVRITAPRRYGKTSLLRAVEGEAERRGFVPVHVDFFGAVRIGEIANKIAEAYTATLTGKARQVFTAIVRTINPKFRIGGKVVPVELEVSLDAATGVITELLNLPLRLHGRTGERCLVVFDEFQVVMDVGETDALIRSVIQHHRDAASYIFAGSDVGMMSALFATKRRAFYAQAAPIPLLLLNASDVGDYVGSRFEQTGKDPGDGFAPLLDTAAGHPQRAMLLAYYLWDLTPPGRTATEEIWTSAFDKATSTLMDEFKRAWEDYTPALRKLITVIAEGNSRLYSAQTGIPRSGSTTRSLRSLANRGDIVDDPSELTRHRIVDPLFGYWLRVGRPSSMYPDPGRDHSPNGPPLE